jgi:hypothetical protein
MANESAVEVRQRGGTALKRRSILAVAGAAVAGIAAKQAAQPVLAGGDNQALVISQTNTSTGNTLLTITGNGGDGVNVKNSNGAAIYGQSDTSFGVYALSKATTGTGMYGQATGSSGIGVGGTSSGFSGIGVIGTANGGTGIGVQGNSATFYGVQGISQTSYGVAGFSGGVGIYGLSSSSYGIVGVTTAGAPFSGITGSANTNGAAAFAGGTTNPSAYAAYFSGAVVVDGSFTVINPANKHGAIQLQDGSHRLLYSMESPESWIEDFGTGRLVGGKAAVALAPDFAAIAQTDDYYVFPVTHDTACKGLAINDRHPNGFEVQELNGGTSSGAFSYRVVARPKNDTKVQRLAKFTPPKIKIPTANELPKKP